MGGGSRQNGEEEEKKQVLLPRTAADCFYDGPRKMRRGEKSVFQ